MQNDGNTWKKVGTGHTYDTPLIFHTRKICLLIFVQLQIQITALKTRCIQQPIIVDSCSDSPFTIICADKSLRPKDLKGYCVTHVGGTYDGLDLCAVHHWHKRSVLFFVVCHCRHEVMCHLWQCAIDGGEAHVSVWWQLIVFLHDQFTLEHMSGLSNSTKLIWIAMVYLAGSKNILSVAACKDVLSQIWDFSEYPQEKKRQEKENEGKNPALGERILKEVLRVYDHASKGLLVVVWLIARRDLFFNQRHYKVDIIACLARALTADETRDVNAGKLLRTFERGWCWLCLSKHYAYRVGCVCTFVFQAKIPVARTTQTMLSLLSANPEGIFVYHLHAKV